MRRNNLTIYVVWTAGIVLLVSLSTRMRQNQRYLDDMFLPTSTTTTTRTRTSSPPPLPRRLIPLTTLTRSFRNADCSSPFVTIDDTILDESLAFEGGRHIPRVVHVTSRSRCMEKNYADAINSWRFPNHSLFLHDDDAIDVLLYRDWEEFPLLQRVFACLPFRGAYKTDIWRLLVMWEYGGIYTDIDNKPAKFNGETLQPEDQGFFQIDVAGAPSQWFFAIAPRHPLMYFSIHRLIRNVLELENVDQPRIVWTTGPGAIQGGFQEFSHKRSPRVAGLVHGVDNSSIRLMGNTSNESEWVLRSVFDEDHRNKVRMMASMNMTHLTRIETGERNMTCLHVLYEEEMKRYSMSS